MMERLRERALKLKKELEVYKLALKDERTPAPARWLIMLAAAYALSPIDLIPDFIPVIGHLDDILIVPLLLAAAVKMIPRDVMADCRKKAMSP